MRPIAVSGIGDDKQAKMRFAIIVGVLAITGYIFFATVQGPKRRKQ